MKTSTMIIGVVVLAVVGIGAYLLLRKNGAASATTQQKGAVSKTGWDFGAKTMETLGSLGGSWLNRGYQQGASGSPSYYGASGDYYGGDW